MLCLKKEKNRKKGISLLMLMKKGKNRKYNGFVKEIYIQKD